MAIQFQENFRNLMVGRGLTALGTANCTVTVFSGTQPSAALIISDWQTGLNIRNSMLVSWASVPIVQSGATSPGTGIWAQSLAPSPINAIGTGVATWGIIWGTSGFALNTGSPLLSTLFMVVPVSNTSGNGVIKLASTSIATGSTQYATSSITINIT